MQYTNPHALINTDWLAKNLTNPKVRILDASYFLPGVKRDPKVEFTAQHIPGSVFFDIEKIADQDSSLPHMLPNESNFSKKISELGIRNDNKIIIYDSSGGGMAAARCWWMFRTFRHDDVAILNGGLPKWIAEGRLTENNTPSPITSDFLCTKNESLVRDISQILANVENGSELVVDARSKERFDGLAPEPRKGSRAGHIPGSLNLPYNNFFSKEQNFIICNAEELTQIVSNAGIDLTRPIITTCGSGVSAALLALGFYLIGKDDVAVYDGSWSEWGMRSDTPVEK